MPNLQFPLFPVKPVNLIPIDENGAPLAPFTGSQIAFPHPKNPLPAHYPSSLEIEEEQFNSPVESTPTVCGGGLIDWDSLEYIPQPCRQWRCPKCGPENGKRVQRRLRDAGVDFNRMLTLPFAIGDLRSWEEAIAVSGQVLNRFFTALRRKFSGISYFWVREVGKHANMVHFHVMVDRFLPQRLMSNMWNQAGGGSVVDIRRVGMSYSLKYLVKYQNLSASLSAALCGKRRWSCSRALLAPIVRSLKAKRFSFSWGSPWDIVGCRIVWYAGGIFGFERKLV